MASLVVEVVPSTFGVLHQISHNHGWNYQVNVLWGPQAQLVLLGPWAACDVLSFCARPVPGCCHGCLVFVNLFHIHMVTVPLD